MKNLPLGISTLRKLIDGDCIYVDKTEMAYHLVKRSGAFFLSRPRRFGKSLFVDTLKEIFEGNQKLFEGLFIHDKWDWSRKYPVIKIDFAGGVLQSREELDARILKMLRQNAERLGIPWNEQSDLPGHLQDIIIGCVQRYSSPAVVLVDEYDKPILDNIERPEAAAQMREGLKNLYSVLKEQDANLQFVFMTGVSKFSKVSLFSGINQLTDITIDAAFSAICGYRDADLRASFHEHLQGVDWDELRLWYNGYGWTGDETVYNPYDILLFISKRQEYRNYWFETGSPSFLVKLFQKNRYFLPSLEGVEATEEILDSFDIETINPVTLLFQTGYLTIDNVLTRHRRRIFSLRVPNFEVKIALNDQFINAYTELVNEKLGLQESLYDVLEKADRGGFENLVKRLFASIPYRNFTSNELLDCEGYYASVLYAFFSSLNAQVIPEDITNHGQTDMTIKLGNRIYVMEIKLVAEPSVEGNPALDQIVARNYAEKYRGTPGQCVHEVGLVFSRATRNLVAVGWR